MAYVPHSKVTWSGILNSGTGVDADNETWSCSMNFGGFGTDPGIDAMTTLASAFSTMLTGGDFDENTWLTEVKFAQIAADGKYPLGYEPIINLPTPSRGGNETATHVPNQIALCVSLGTGLRGPSRRGRMYLPTPTAPVGNGGEISTAKQADYIGGFEAFFDAVGTALIADIGGPGPIIASRNGYDTTITQLRIGLVLDTQRRRRRSLKENYGPPITIGPLPG